MWIPKGAAFIRGRRLFEARCLLEEKQYLFFTAMKIRTMAYIVKKKTNFIFVHQLHKLVRCVSPLPSGMEQLHRHHYLSVLKSSLYNAYMRLYDHHFYLLIPHAPLLHSVQSFSFELKRNTIGILCC